MIYSLYRYYNKLKYTLIRINTKLIIIREFIKKRYYASTLNNRHKF